jgi:large subunit ribosomal protein L18
MKTKKNITRNERRERRRVRVRARIFGTAEKPRLNVYRSLKGMFGQIIDDSQNKTMFSLHSKLIKSKDTDDRKAKVAVGYLLGKTLAEKAVQAGIKKVVFDRAGYHYHGRVKSFAEGAREGGLEF